MWRFSIALPVVLFLTGLSLLYFLLFHTGELDIDEDGLKLVKKGPNTFSVPRENDRMNSFGSEGSFFSQRSLGDSYVLICPLFENNLTRMTTSLLSNMLEQRKKFFSTDITIEGHDMCAVTHHSLSHAPSTRAVITLSVVPHYARLGRSYLCLPGTGGSPPNLNMVATALLFSRTHHLPTSILCIEPHVQEKDVKLGISMIKNVFSHLRTFRMIVTHMRIPSSRSVHFLLYLKEGDYRALEKLALTVMDVADGVSRMNKDFHRTLFGWINVLQNKNRVLTYMHYQSPSYLFISVIAFSAISALFSCQPERVRLTSSSCVLPQSWKGCVAVIVVIAIAPYACTGGYPYALSTSLVLSCIYYSICSNVLFCCVAVCEAVALATCHASQSEEALMIGAFLAAQWVCCLNPLTRCCCFMKIVSLSFFCGYLYLLSAFNEIMNCNCFLLFLMDWNTTLFVFHFAHLI